MTSWMKSLSAHYEAMRKRFPDDRLIILFDIDGTILDARHMIHYILKSYDTCCETFYFSGPRSHGGHSVVSDSTPHVRGSEHGKTGGNQAGYLALAIVAIFIRAWRKAR